MKFTLVDYLKVIADWDESYDIAEKVAQAQLAYTLRELAAGSRRVADSHEAFTQLPEDLVDTTERVAIHLAIATAFRAQADALEEAAADA